MHGGITICCSCRGAGKIDLPFFLFSCGHPKALLDSISIQDGSVLPGLASRKPTDRARGGAWPAFSPNILRPGLSSAACVRAHRRYGARLLVHRSGRSGFFVRYLEFTTMMN